MEVDLYFEPIFWLLRGMPWKTQKPAAESCIFCCGKSWALVMTNKSYDSEVVTNSIISWSESSL